MTLPLGTRVTAARERPILFSSGMVKAILAGTKSQTRRVVKPQAPADFHALAPKTPGSDEWAFSNLTGEEVAKNYAGKWLLVRCPYGAPGDLLWVKENFRLRADQDDKRPSDDWWKSGAWYAADGPASMPSGCAGGAGKLRPSIFMPRWASRITLRITDVRVERVQDISCADAIAEGIAPAATSATIDCDTPDPRRAYASLWDGINAKREGYAWESNPFVWCVHFERVTP